MPRTYGADDTTHAHRAELPADNQTPAANCTHKSGSRLINGNTPSTNGLKIDYPPNRRWEHVVNHSYEPRSTALLVVDPYNDFMTEGGKLYDAIRDTATESGMFEHLRAILRVVRANGIRVFVVPHHRSTPGDFDGWKHMSLFQEAGLPMKAFEAGTWGGEFNEEFGPKAGDVVVMEHWAQSGFANTDLDMLLKQNGIEKLILVGLIANSCIESTARFGMELGYHVTLVPDATAAFSREGMVAAATNAPMFAHAVMTTDELLVALS